MTDRAKFDVILGDRVSPGAKSAAGSVAALQRQLRAANADVRSSSTALSRWGVQIRTDFAARARALTGLNNTTGTIGRAGYMSFQRWGAGATQAGENVSGLVGRFAGLAGAAGVIAMVAAKALEAGAAFAEMGTKAGAAYLRVASFREDSIQSLSTVLRSQTSANRSFNNALIMASQTPLDPQDVISSFTSFAVGGFNANELAPLTAAVADVQAARGNTAADSLTRVLTQIRGLGRVQRGDITMQGISAGLNAQDIFGSIARQMGLGQGAAGRKAAERAVSRGRVNDRVAIQAFLDSVRNRYDGGGDLGSFARGASGTLSGAISNLKGAMFTLMAGLDLSRTPGVIAFRDAVLAITSALDASSVSGKELREVLVESANALGTELFGGMDAASISRGVRDVIPVIRAVVAVTRGAIFLGRIFWSGMAEGGRAVIGVFKLVAEEFDRQLAIADFGGRLIESLLTLPERMLGLGHDTAGAILTGFTEGLLSAPTTIDDAVTGAFTSAVDAARGALDWHSPSGVFKDAGRAVAEGFELGVTGGRPAVDAAVAQLVAPRGLGPGATTSSRGTAPVINITIEGRDRTDTAIVDEMMVRLNDLFETMALQGATDATS